MTARPNTVRVNIGSGTDWVSAAGRDTIGISVGDLDPDRTLTMDTRVINKIYVQPVLSKNIQPQNELICKCGLLILIFKNMLTELERNRWYILFSRINI